MDKKTLNRARMVKAMELLARSINDEEIFMSWLMCGVADGDIDEVTTCEEIVEMGYTDDSTMVDLMDCFLRCMHRAYKSGGIWADLDAISTVGDREE